MSDFVKSHRGSRSKKRFAMFRRVAVMTVATVLLDDACKAYHIVAVVIIH